LTIRQKIFEAPDLLLLRSGDDTKENLRTAYEMALIIDGDPAGTKEKADAMFNRTGKFLWAYHDELKAILNDFTDRTGLTGGAVGPATMGDIQHLSEPDAKELFDIFFSIQEAEKFKRDLIGEMIAWSVKK